MRSFNEEGLSPKRRFVFVQNSPIKAISSSEMKSKKDLVRIQYHSKIFYCIHFATESIRPLHKLKSNQNFFWFFLSFFLVFFLDLLNELFLFWMHLCFFSFFLFFFFSCYARCHKHGLLKLCWKTTNLRDCLKMET